MSKVSGGESAAFFRVKIEKYLSILLIIIRNCMYLAEYVVKKEIKLSDTDKPFKYQQLPIKSRNNKV